MSPVQLRILKSSDRGHADHDWLKTYHHFSFASYFNPDMQNFGALRQFSYLLISLNVEILTSSGITGVINEDRVAGAEGFGTHPHREFEIFSYIVDGELKRESRFSIACTSSSTNPLALNRQRFTRKCRSNETRRHPNDLYRYRSLPFRIQCSPR